MFQGRPEALFQSAKFRSRSFIHKDMMILNKTASNLLHFSKSSTMCIPPFETWVFFLRIPKTFCSSSWIRIKQKKMIHWPNQWSNIRYVLGLFHLSNFVDFPLNWNCTSFWKLEVQWLDFFCEKSTFNFFCSCIIFIQHFWDIANIQPVAFILTSGRDEAVQVHMHGR